MTREEAEEKFGRLILPKEASRILQCTQPNINDLEKRNRLKKIIVEIKENGKTKEKHYCIESEVKLLKQQKEEKEAQKQQKALEKEPEGPKEYKEMA